MDPRKGTETYLFQSVVYASLDLNNGSPEGDGNLFKDSHAIVHLSI